MKSSNAGQFHLVSDLIMGLLRDLNVDRIYGAPGTTELSLVQSAARYGIEYYFTLHDTVAVGMADGFSRCSNRISVVNLHSAQGLLNASGFIRVASRDNVPLLIIAGIPSTTYDVYEPNHYLLNLQQSLLTISKWGWTVHNVETLGDVFARAVSISLSHPAGPTFILVPQNILESQVAESFAGARQLPSMSTPRYVAARESIEHAARSLARAQAPIVFAGYGGQNSVHWVETIADIVAAPIIAEALDRGPQVHNVYCRTNHPLFLSFFDVRDQKIKQIIGEADAVLFVGGKATYSKVIGELPEHCMVIELNANREAIGKGHRVDIPCVGDIGLSLEQICDRLRPEITQCEMDDVVKTRKESRINEVSEYKRHKYEKLSNVILHGSPIVGMQLVKAMTESLPSDAIIVDDSQCMGYYIKHYYPFSERHTLYGSMASHLGWALPASLGIKQANNSQPVVCLVGDGSFMFGLQALATASTYEIPILIIIANNQGYASLKKEISVKGRLTPTIEQNLSLDHPQFDYSLLAKSMGLAGLRVSEASDLSHTIQSGFGKVTRDRKACVVDVVMSNSWEDWDESWYVPAPNRIPCETDQAMDKL